MNEGTPFARRKFAARYENRGWGITLTIFGAIYIIYGIVEEPISLILAAGLIVWGVYLLRGRGENPKKTAARQAREQKRAAVAQSSVDSAKAALAAAGASGAGLVAYRNLELTTQKHYREEASVVMQSALASIPFDPSWLAANLIGYIPTVDGSQLEIFDRWIINGQQGYDVDETTRGEVFLDNTVSLQNTKNGAQQVQNQQQAHVTIASRMWSFSVDINPAMVSEARRIFVHLTALTESLKPAAVTAADMQNMVDKILDATEISPAEKLEQLSNLRYQRLMSDADFESAKRQILGI